MKIEIDDEVADKILVENLSWMVDYWEGQLKRYKDPDHGFIALFSTNKEEDKKEIKKMIKASNLLLKFYGVVR